MKMWIAMIGLLAFIGCAAPAPPDYASQYKPAIDAAVQVWSGGDLSVLDATLAQDIRRTSPGGLSTNGLAAYKELVKGMHASYPDMKLVIDEAIYIKDVAVVRWTHSGTNTGPGEIPPTGKKVSNSGASILRFKDGKLVEELVYFDVLNWQQQLGYTVTPPAGS